MYIINSNEFYLYFYRVHALGNLKKSKDHPDSRAILYEEKAYSKRKVLDFISVLNGYTAALKLTELFCDTDSVLLKRITQLSPNGKFPDYRETLKFFKVINLTKLFISRIMIYGTVWLVK